MSVPDEKARADRITASVALGGAALCVLGLVATYAVATLSPLGQTHDAVALYGFTQLGRPRVDAIANAVAGLVNPRPYAVFGAILVAVALLRRRPRVALAVVACVGGAVASAELLKPLLAHPHNPTAGHKIIAASWPSGHSTGAMTLALCAVMVAPAALRSAVAALGAVFAVAVSFSLLTLAWHLPSDVVGGYLLAGLWVALAVAALRGAEARWPRRARLAGRRARTLPALDALVPVAVLAIAAGLVAGALIVRPHQVAAFADAHRSLVVAGAAISAVAAALASALTVVLRR